MPVTQDLLEKIRQYEEQGYTADEIVQGLASSQNYPDVAAKAQGYLSSGYSHDEILAGMKSSPIVGAPAPTGPYAVDPDNPKVPNGMSPKTQALVEQNLPWMAADIKPRAAAVQPQAAPIDTIASHNPPPLVPPAAPAPPVDNYQPQPTISALYSTPTAEKNREAEAGRFLPAIGEGVLGATTGIAAFLGGAGAALYDLALPPAERAYSKTPFRDAVNKAESIMEMAYQPRTPEGQLVAELPALPFTKVDEFITSKIPAEWPDEAKAAAKLATWGALLAAPPALRASKRFIVDTTAKTLRMDLGAEISQGDILRADPEMRAQAAGARMTPEQPITQGPQKALPAPVIAQPGGAIEPAVTMASESGPAPATTPPGGTPPPPRAPIPAAALPAPLSATEPPRATSPEIPGEGPKVAPTQSGQNAPQTEAGSSRERLAKVLTDAGHGPGTPVYEAAMAEHRAVAREADPVTGYQPGDYRPKAFERIRNDALKTGEPASIGSIDLRNLGGLNKHMGGEAKANQHLRAITDLIKQTVDEKIGQPAQYFKQGGDEYSIVANVPQDVLEGALQEATAAVDKYAAKNNLNEIPHPKSKPEAPIPSGIGIYHGTADLAKATSVEDAILEAESNVYGKKEAAYGGGGNAGKEIRPNAPIEKPGEIAAGAKGEVEAAQGQPKEEPARQEIGQISTPPAEGTPESLTPEEKTNIFGAAAGMVKGIQSENYIFEDEDGNTVMSDKAWSNVYDMAPWLAGNLKEGKGGKAEKGLSYEKIVEVLEKAAEGIMPRKGAVAQQRILDEVLTYYAREKANQKFRDEMEAEEVPFDQGGYDLEKKGKPDLEGAMRDARVIKNMSQWRQRLLNAPDSMGNAKPQQKVDFENKIHELTDLVLESIRDPKYVEAMKAAGLPAPEGIMPIPTVRMVFDHATVLGTPINGFGLRGYPGFKGKLVRSGWGDFVRMEPLRPDDKLLPYNQTIILHGTGPRAEAYQRREALKDLLKDHRALVQSFRRHRSRKELMAWLNDKDYYAEIRGRKLNRQEVTDIVKARTGLSLEDFWRVVKGDKDIKSPQLEAAVKSLTAPDETGLKQEELPLGTEELEVGQHPDKFKKPEFKLTAEQEKAKKAKPVQEGLDLGTKGKDLGKETKAEGVDINETELGKATNAAEDRGKQGGFAFDEGGYDLSKVQTSLELPEIVRLIKKLTGRYPNVHPGKIKTAVGIALGYFDPKTQKIVIASDLAAIEGLTERVLAHEGGHALDYSGAPGNETINRGNILGRIASLRKYMKDLLEEFPGAPGKLLTDADRARFKKEASDRAKKEALEAAGQTDAFKDTSGERIVSPEEILSIWRDVNAREKNKDLHDYIARLSDAEKKAIVRQAMKGISNVVLKTGDRAKIPNYGDLSKREKEIYQELLREEIIKRRLYEKEVIMDELKRLTQMIKPFDDMADPAKTKYRYSSVELYADAISTLLNDPEMLKDVAPTFRKAFLNYLERKPEFKQEWERLQEASATDREQILRERQDFSTEGYKLAEERIAARQKEERMPILHELYKGLIEKHADLYAKAKEVEKRNGMIEDTKDPRYWVQELPYINGPVYLFLKDHDRLVLKPLAKAGITIDHMGELFERMRAATERASMHNPGGMTPEASLDAIEKLKRDLGPEKYAVLEKAYNDAQRLWQEHVVSMMEETDIWSPQLLEYAKNNGNYATFQHVQEFTGKLEEQLGPTNTARVYKQIGTFQQIRNPYIATVMKGISLMRAAQVNNAIKHAAEFLLQNFDSKTIQEAKGHFNGRWMEYKEPSSNRVGLLVFTDKGKTRAYYVPKGIAESFEQEPHAAKVIMTVWNLINVPLRNLLVSWNPGWMVYNVPRDFIESWKNTPKLSVGRLLERYFQAAPHAFMDVFLDKQTPIVREMYKRKEIVVERHFSSKDTEAEHELETITKSFGISPTRYQRIVLNPLAKIADYLSRPGKFSERLSKIAAKLEMKARERQGQIQPRKASYMVRQRMGTPDVHAGGAWKAFYNNLFLFSNMGVRGFYASWESFKERKAEYIFKTLKYNIIPKLALAAAGAGLAGAAAKEIIDGVSEYYKTNYQVIPLGKSQNGKSVVLSLPQDYTGTAISAIVWKLSQGKMLGPKGLGATIAQQGPYGLNPYIAAGADLLAISQGLNPYDDFHGRLVVPDEVWKAGGTRVAEAVAKYEAQQLGAGGFIKFNSDDPNKVKSELEEFLDFPGHLFGLDRYLKVTDYGHKEKLKDVTAEVGQEEARHHLDVKDAILESIKETKGNATDEQIEKVFDDLKKKGVLDERTRPREFWAQYRRRASGKFDDIKIDAFINARSSEEKAALLEHYKGTMGTQEFTALYDQLIEEGYLKRGVIRHFNTLMEEGNGARK